MLEHLRGNLLPLRYRRCRHGTVELLTKRPCISVIREGRILPRLTARRKITGEPVELGLNLGSREILHQLPRLVLAFRAAKQRETGTTRQRHARPVDAGKRSCHPLVLHCGREAVGEFADLPRSADVHRDVPALELLIEVRYLRSAEGRRQTVAKKTYVEVERLAERRLGESAVGAVLIEEPGTCLESEYYRRWPLGYRNEQRILPSGH